MQPFIKFADDTTVVGLISNRDETNYRSEVSRLAGWCSDNNLSLNVEKTKEIVVDFRRVHSLHAPLTINGATVERVSSTKFLGVHITEDLSWTNNTAALAKKAQQRLYFLRKLRRARAPAPIMCTFYRGTIESILTSCITVWYGACNASCRKSLQRIVRAAEKIVGVSLPSLQDIYNTRLTRKALSIAGDPTHPTHNFFSLLPSGRRLRSLQARTNRLKDSFIHQAVRKLNSLPSLPPSRPCPPSPLLPHKSLNSDPHPTTTHTNTHTHTHTHTHSHTHTHTETSTGHLYSIGLTSFNYLFWQSEQKRLLLVTLNSLDKLFALHHLYSALFVCLFISLICTICHVPYATLSIFYIIIFSFLFNVLFFYFFLHVLICIFVIVAFVCMYVCVCVCMCVCICICVCMCVCIYTVYIYMCIYVYIYIYIYIYIYRFVLICIFAFYCLCLALSVCTRE